jgi:hypothetical protein
MGKHRAADGSLSTMERSLRSFQIYWEDTRMMPVVNMPTKAIKIVELSITPEKTTEEIFDMVTPSDAPRNGTRKTLASRVRYGKFIQWIAGKKEAWKTR